jgi:glycosyltransferase involved in cell wall biosynthesis
MPKVSVIVPNYNHAPYLKQRIESILNQSYQNFEVLLLDDCSTDGSHEVLLSYKDHPKVTQVVFNEKNSGSAFLQWSQGILLAKGEYVWIAESDDWAEPELLTELVRLLDIYPRAGLAYCNSAFFQMDQQYADSASEKASKFKSDHWAYEYCVSGKEEIEHALLWDCTINNVSSVLMRKSVISSLFPLNRPFVYSGDWYCYLRIATISDIAYTPKTLNNYRNHACNISKKAGYNYLIELFYIYDWLWSSSFGIQSKTLVKAFHHCVSDLYASGLLWKLKRDYRQLFPINRWLYLIMSVKLLRRKIRRCFIR